MTQHHTARHAFTGLLIAALLCPPAAAQARRRPPSEREAPGFNLVELPEEKTRRNIGAFFDKLRAGKPVTVAYLGGSITAGAAATDPAKTSYRALVTEWLRQQHPRATVTQINAAVGGTGSPYGALRTRRDVIAHKPDLVFVEFAVNDAGEEEEAVRRSVEGILRQLLLMPQPPEIVMLYATNGKRQARVDWHEPLAAHYQVPAVDLQTQAWELIAAGKVAPATLWKEGAQPLDEGHKIFAQLVTAFLAEQAKLKPSPLLKSLPPPLVSDEMTYGELKPFAEIKHGAAWRVEPVSDRTLPATLLASDKAGAELEVLFDGSAVGIAFRAGPDVGVFECLIDGKPAPAPLARVDAYDATHRIKTRIIAGGLPPGEHRLTIRLLDEKNPKSVGHQIRLGYFLLGGPRPERL